MSSWEVCAWYRARFGRGSFCVGMHYRPGEYVDLVVRDEIDVALGLERAAMDLARATARTRRYHDGGTRRDMVEVTVPDMSVLVRYGDQYLTLHELQPTASDATPWDAMEREREQERAGIYDSGPGARPHFVRIPGCSLSTSADMDMDIIAQWHTAAARHIRAMAVRIWRWAHDTRAHADAAKNITDGLSNHIP